MKKKHALIVMRHVLKRETNKLVSAHKEALIKQTEQILAQLSNKELTNILLQEGINIDEAKEKKKL